MIMKQIPNFPSYFATKDGRIQSKRFKRFLKPALSREGYFRVCLCKNGKHYIRSIHRLILKAFIGPCPNGMQCRHLNGIKTDNRISNLVWGTRKENAADCKLHGTDPLGERNGHVKLTEQDVKEIRQIYKTQFHWGLRCQLAKKYNVTPQNIRCIAKKLTWKHI